MYNLILRGYGVVLLTAVVLKVQGLSSGTASVNYFSPVLQLAALEVETVVGLWLVFGWARRAAWGAAVMLFMGLAVVSLYLAMVGQDSCGCFGRVRISPWQSFAFDVACLVALAVWRPTGLTVRSQLPVLVVATVLTVLGLAGPTVLSSQAGQNWLARMRGEWLSLEPSEYDLGDCADGDQKTFRVTVINRSDRAVRLVGGTNDCSCLATADLPVTVPANGLLDVAVTVRVVGAPGHFKSEYSFFTDASQQREIFGRTAGWVTAGARNP